MGYHPVCRVDDLAVERGAAALVNGQAIALFRTPDGLVHALSNHDPFAQTAGLARGIAGTPEQYADSTQRCGCH